MNSATTLSNCLPILTTILSVVFALDIFRRFSRKSGSFHLLWWGIGIAIYGFGTLMGSLTTLFGWHPVIFKAWYISGALLAGAPLAIGTIYLLFGRKAGYVACKRSGVIDPLARGPDRAEFRSNL